MASLEQAREQQAAQRGLILLMLQDLTRTWVNLDPARLAVTLPRWITAVLGVISRYGDAAGALALATPAPDRMPAASRGPRPPRTPGPPAGGPCSPHGGG